MPGIKLALVNMPWHGLQMPSISVGVLHAAVNREIPEVVVRDYYGNLEWAEYLLAESDDQITPENYQIIADSGMLHGVGDWIFASALYGDEEWKLAEFDSYSRDHELLELARIARPMRQYATGFVNLISREVISESPDVVGFTTSFSQTIPSLAVARRIKEFNPGITVVFGGANCEDTMGIAIHRNFPFVDYVVRGEGERSLPELLRSFRTRSASKLNSIAGLCWRDDIGNTKSAPAAGSVPIDDIPAPDYSQWAMEFEKSACGDYVQPVLCMETARGCWWGERHHCKFCGLNGTLMQYRAKSAARAWAELETMVLNYRVLDIVTTDNILAPEYFREFLPRVAASGWDLRIHYEVKANLTEEQLRLLREAGVVHIQPGIESLGTRVLQLMDKGVHGTQNVRLLRDSEELGLTVSWSYLYGFPGELPSDYDGILQQVPNLFHLQPPSGCSRIMIERFAPYFNNKTLGFEQHRPHRSYNHLYDLPEQELMDLAYLFESPPRGIGGELEVRLKKLLERWEEAYRRARLLMRVEGTALVIEDTRDPRNEREHRIDDPVLRKSYMSLRKPRSEQAFLQDAQGYGLGAVSAQDWLEELSESGLVFREGGRVVSLATSSSAVRGSK